MQLECGECVLGVTELTDTGTDCVYSKTVSHKKKQDQSETVVACWWALTKVLGAAGRTGDSLRERSLDEIKYCVAFHTSNCLQLTAHFQDISGRDPQRCEDCTQHSANPDTNCVQRSSVYRSLVGQLATTLLNDTIIAAI